tara:strand:- start:26989 stop:28791 length:1803 start_codon:yes stop_codon:yes gene_type:complete
MIFKKKHLNKQFKSFNYFYSYLKNKIFIAVFLSLSVGILGGFGLTMFLPLLQMVNDTGEINSDNLGNLSFIVENLENLGVNLNLLNILMVMIVFFVFKGIAQYLSRLYRIILQQNFVKEMRVKMLNSLNEISFNYFVKSDVGRIQNTMTGEVEKVTLAFNFYFQSIEQFILVTTYTLFTLFIDFQFSILVILGGALTNIIYRTIYKQTKNASRSLTKDTNYYQGQVIQHVNNYKYLKATGLINKFGNKLKLSIEKIEINRKRLGIFSSIMSASREPLIIIVLATIILIYTKIIGGSLAGVLLTLLFFYRALTALVQMQNSWNKYLENTGSIENVMDFQSKLENKYESDGKINFKEFNDKIKLANINYSYNDTRVLNKINIELKKNKSYAFIGESGSGKTTLINIIVGLLSTDCGLITVDGLNYKDIVKSSFQKRIGYITQETVIFNDSIFNNITFWAEKTQDNLYKYESIIKKAYLSDMINQFPEKSETLLGNNGINLSGGQKQRISIARELFKDVDILVLDEATSSLDTETEKNIQNSIDSLKDSYTLLVIAHRLSTIKNIDTIFLIENGEIVEKGDFNYLIKKRPSFRNLVKLQVLQK